MDSEASAWAIGTRLVLDGLSTSDLNGLVASVSVPFDSSSGRYVVKLESDDRVVRVKPSNLLTIQDRIRAIQRDLTLDGATKAKLIHTLYSRSQPKASEKTDDSAEGKKKTAADTPPCGHYVCECVVVSACCGKVVQCRFCHDEHVRDHKIDRFATSEIICKACDTLQGVSNLCIQCGVQFGGYFCGICKLWKADDAVGTFHCDGCGICRVGKREDYVHCDTCAMCLPTAGVADHKCFEAKFKQDCPVCRVDMFSSRESASTMPCGHPIHSSCLNSLTRNSANGWPRCPLCKRSVVPMESTWAAMQAEIDAQPMPPPSESGCPATVSVHCNDCGLDSSPVPFHFLGCRCSTCGSFNTAISSSSSEDQSPEERDPGEEEEE